MGQEEAPSTAGTGEAATRVKSWGLVCSRTGVVSWKMDRRMDFVIEEESDVSE